MPEGPVAAVRGRGVSAAINPPPPLEGLSNRLEQRLGSIQVLWLASLIVKRESEYDLIVRS